MKSLIVLTLFSIVAIAWTKPATYTDKWDHINVEEILESDRLLRGYADCLMDKGRCTSDAKALKETLPDALEHDCSKCTAKQKTSADKVLKHMINKRPKIWDELATKYDPKHIYQVKYKDRIDAAKGKA
ncbi:allergen Tha p 1 [Bicyclus anynana]|uniref:Allergen Tha p 1 n=1 Tax=Bicyclus anynana TaxID=110368 RepID=A0A6J1N3Q1_BICAN|nr:allergen Tha p 1 [Bicyclus anynana]